MTVKGYFSLAQANFTSTSRQRYGQDYYDERMQASRTVMIGQNDDEVGRFTMSRASAENGTKEGSDLPPDAKDEDERKEKIDPRPVDPISWFGILVPPALRSAQSRFVNAVEGSIPRVATLAKELRTIEIEIGRARKAIKKLDKG
ncbi:hypothetical protein EJ08DRAFT_372696 [Tothia fuscella]|uniref:Vacuolar ATPase assembly protein VMA22 n=1 Tax=Tothia fuscella TaxID=1048955 RepID=A0A9P4NL12_9PEZI|nr:hypothetical protein EJ08DRAFT_372696 [Tothia fuscella]